MDQVEQKQDHSHRSKIEALNVPELYQCVHCGLCLNQCPTYRVLHIESESPRGRIHLVRAAAEGRIEPNERFGDHIYLCLMCRACETACPSGVQYGRIAESARELLGPPGSPLARALTKFAFIYLLPYAPRLRMVARFLRLYQRSGTERLVHKYLPKRLREMNEMLPSVPNHFFRPAAEVMPAIGKTRARVGMLSGCVMSILFPDINEATLRVLRLNGCDVVIPKRQICCGALNIHNGETTMAKKMARQNIDAFLGSNLDAVIVNAAGCGAAMKEYGHLLRDDPTYAERAQSFGRLVKDASEFLAELGLVGPLGQIEMAVTYQDPCHLAHGQKIKAQPRQLLKAIPGIQFTEMNASDRCCGSAGIYNLTHPEMSQELLREKMEAIAQTSAQAVIAPNPGCMLQLRYGAKRYGPPVQVFHLMDLLERAYDPAQNPSSK
ncbi:MAG TPA: heterodisulfide reductase-related iron-sulfur binding cluster [Candidatus Binatia bacterium]|nr:heterodisulfide reductase-related iron-sulfur binding cluster [Candidatus Binatia bacterium]